MKYFIIAGEASGDLHGANLIKELKKEDSNAEFRFWGGDLMLAESANIGKHYKEMAFMGFVEVLMNLSSIFANMRVYKKDILAYQPDALILIDFPGFNLKIAEFAKANNIKVFYYISPKVWAWNEKRVLKIKKVVDHLFCIFPFEVDFYAKWEMNVDYVGNPLLDAINAYHFDKSFFQDIQRPIVALLPGSRKQEVSKILPVMVKVSSHFPDYQFIIAGAPSFNEEYYHPFQPQEPLPIVFGKTYDLVKNAKAAIVASGTATLETALLNTPQVVVYKGNPISIAIGRLVVKIKFISLVNLIANKLIVKELIQDKCNEQSLTNELKLLLDEKGTYRQNMLDNYTYLHSLMGDVGASKRTANLIVQYLEK
jgi:lipid-A-disaccharide synthase